MSRCGPRQGTAQPGEVFSEPNPLHKLWNLLHLVASSFTGVVTALSDRLGRGAVPCPANRSTSILPGLRLFDRPVKCPLNARAIDIFRGCTF